MRHGLFQQYSTCYRKYPWECHADTYQHSIPFCNWLPLQCWCSNWSHPSARSLNNWSGLKILFRFAINGICFWSPQALMTEKGSNWYLLASYMIAAVSCTEKLCPTYPSCDLITLYIIKHVPTMLVAPHWPKISNRAISFRFFAFRFSRLLFFSTCRVRHRQVLWLMSSYMCFTSVSFSPMVWC